MFDRIKEKKISGKGLLKLGLFLAALCGGACYLVFLGKSESIHYTVVSHNTGGPCTNPVEYRSQIEQIEETTQNQQLKQAAAKMIEVDDNAYRCLGTMDVSEIIRESDVAAIAEAAGMENPEAWAKDFMKMYGTMKYREAIKALTSTSKIIRDMGKDTYSPIHYNREMIAYCRTHAAIDREAYLKTWIDHIKPFLPEVKELYARKKSTDPDKFCGGLVHNFMLDYYAVIHLFEIEGAPQAWAYFTEVLGRGMDQADEMCLRLYETECPRPAIICLQEATASLVTKIKESGYLIAGSKVRPDYSKQVIGSVILLDKKAFNETDIQETCYLSQESIDKYKMGEKDRNLKKLTNKADEVAMVLVKHFNKYFLIVSFHADSAGNNTLVGINSIIDRHAELEEKYGQKIMLIMCCDGNTTNYVKANTNKRPISEVTNLLQDRDNAYKLVCPDLNVRTMAGLGTVNKKRSAMQGQMSKVHLAYKGISDFIIVSFVITKAGDQYRIVPKKHKVSPAGPNLENNPADHTALFLCFTVEKKS